MLYLALVIAVLIPFSFFLYIRGLDKYKTSRVSFHALTFVWGILAYLLAAQINPAIIHLGWASRITVIRVLAPILEEILKSLILIYLIQRPDFNFIVDGVIYGFGAGIGFAIAENFEYVTGHPEMALAVALARVFSTNLIHATGTGIISGGLAYRRSDLSWKAWLYIFAGYGVSILFHIIFNTIVSAGVAIVVAFIFGAAGGAFIWYLIRQGMQVQKLWVKEKLDSAARATKEETKLASQIDVIEELLAPLKARFGPSTVTLIRTYIYKQGEIGIKRRLLETAPNPERRSEIQEIINGLIEETNQLRKQIGSYCMLQVRVVYSGQETQLWNLLNARVAAAGLGQKGGGLWDRMNTKIKDANAAQDDK
ncbi:MAG: PrsW family intramembrane metalloprotease [Anaerolineales bacterium]|nr:PrsW family intramembrane metalloprotease [Anaerolineales bacterium]